MKQFKKACPISRHILAGGLLFPAAACITYLVGLLSGVIATSFRYDMLCLIAETAKIYATCAIVAFSCSLLAQCLYRERA